MDIKSIINNKRYKKELSQDEIKLFVSKYRKKEVTEAQAGAFMSCIHQNGMTNNEIIDFANAMADSGEKIDLDDIGIDVADEYSIGGIGDKVSLILLAVIASLDMPISKISSGNSGLASGISKKLESIPGFNANDSISEFKEIIKTNKVGILNSVDNLNPVEKEVYRIKNEIACFDSVPIIVSNLLSLSISMGSKKIVFEIVYGKGSYITTKEQAKKIAQTLKNCGKKLGKTIKCVIINSLEPVGYSVGYNLEIIEVINSLKGSMAFDLGESIVTIGSIILALDKQNSNIKENENNIKEVLANGKAYEKFIQMVKAYGGDTSFIENPEKFEKAEYIMPVYATDTGYISEIDSDIVSSIAWYLGAGRMNNEEDINKTAGIVLEKKIGDEVKTGEIVAYIHTNDEEKMWGAVKNLENAFHMSKKKVAPVSRIVEII